MLTQSQEIDKLSQALSQAQGAAVAKTSVNPHFRSKYADLATCIDACTEALKANGLCVLTLGGVAEGNIFRGASMLTHSSGQWIRSEFAIPLPKGDPQGYGTVYTYARRYFLSAWCNLAAEDDDANSVSVQPGGKVIPISQAAKADKADTIKSLILQATSVKELMEVKPMLEELRKAKHHRHDELQNLGQMRLAELGQVPK